MSTNSPGTTVGRPQTIVYIDGFNFYHGAVKGTQYKWLDFTALCQRMLPRDQLIKIRYFTSRISARPGDPQQPIRQETYLRALAALPLVEIHYGHFVTRSVRLPRANRQPGESRTVEVLRTEEKGSVWVPIIRSWALTRGFALHPATRNRHEIRYTRTQHRPASRHVNDHGRVSGTHRIPHVQPRTLTLLTPTSNAKSPFGKRTSQRLGEAGLDVGPNQQLPSSARTAIPAISARFCASHIAEYHAGRSAVAL